MTALSRELVAPLGAAPCVCLQVFPTDDATAEGSSAVRGTVAWGQPARSTGN